PRRLKVQAKATEHRKCCLSEKSLAQKNRCSNSERRSDHQRQHRREESPPYFTKYPLPFGGGIPNASGDEPGAIALRGRYCRDGDSQDDKGDQCDGKAGKNQAHGAESAVDQQLHSSRSLGDLPFSRLEHFSRRADRKPLRSAG